jgi:DNA-directed RNA polymerase specialized sigma24 family protein
MNMAVKEALDKLAVEYPSLAELVKLRYFAGVTNEEATPLLNVSVSTAKKHWAISRARLLHEIQKNR